VAQNERPLVTAIWGDTPIQAIPFDMRWNQLRGILHARMAPNDPRRSLLNERQHQKHEGTFSRLLALNAQLDAEWDANHNPVLRKLRGDYLDARRRLHQIGLQHRDLIRHVPARNPDRQILRDLFDGWNVPLPPVAEGDVEFSSEAEGRAALAEMQARCVDAESRCERLKNILHHEQCEPSAKNHALVVALWSHIQRLESRVHGLEHALSETTRRPAVVKSPRRAKGK
jgi:hypothetical protein